MNSTARQRFAQMMQQEQAQQEQQQMLTKMRAPAASARGAPMGRAGQMMGALKMANGGAVGPLPSLQELSRPDYQYQDPAFGATAPFTQQNPIVPMFNLEAPAYGGMQQSTYDWTAPIVQGGQFSQPAREAPAMVESTSAYRPVDATTLPGGGVNIPNVPVSPDRPQPTAPSAPSPMEQLMMPPVATTSTGAIPGVITAEERQRREANAAAQAQSEAQARAEAAAQYQAQVEEEERKRIEQAGIMAELARQKQAEQAAIEANAQAQAQAQARAQEEQALAQTQAETERRQRAQAASDAAERAERARQAEALQKNEANSVMNFLSGGIRDVIGGEGLPIYDPNKLVSVTRLVDGGRGGQIVEKIPQSQYDIEQARAKAYQDAFGAE